MRRRTIVIALGLGLVGVPVYPCGGPAADIVDLPLIPVHHFVVRTFYEEEYEHEVRAEFRFLEPFRRDNPDSISALYQFAYERGRSNDDAVPDTVRQRLDREVLSETRAAVRRGAFVDAASAARRVVDHVLETPAGVATAYRDVLRTAVEVVDVAPRLTLADRDIAARYFDADSTARQALHPAGLPTVLREALAIRSLPRDSAAAYVAAHPSTSRRASLRFVALQESMRVGIPDGWASVIADSVTPERWAELERMHDAWLREFGSHPMADYVRFSKVRLYYFKGDRDRAWNQLLTIYPRRRQRVLGEMRYLVCQGMLPPSLDDPRIDWPLRAALVMDVNTTPAQWNAYWRASETRGESWAVPLQERLLWRAIELAAVNRALPEAFPARAAAPTGVWAKLRLLALLEVGDIAAAFPQADSAEAFVQRDTIGDPDGNDHGVTDIDAIRARLHLLQRDWGRAIAAVSDDGSMGAEYLVRVLAPASVVDSLARSPESRMTREARLTAAARHAYAGDWALASRLAATTGDPLLTRRWARTASLARDRSRAGHLAFARWMRDQRGALFFGERSEWLRGLNWRHRRLSSDTVADIDGRGKLDPRLPWKSAEERARIAVHLRSTTELHYALQAYARWLDGATAATPGLAGVVHEADGVYNRLVNWDNNNSPFWAEALENGPEARAIRRAGRLVRRR